MTLRLRGREMAHQEFGIRLLERIAATSNRMIAEQFPRLEGRQMVMLLAPKKTLITKHPPNKPEAGHAPAKAQKVLPRYRRGQQQREHHAQDEDQERREEAPSAGAAASSARRHQAPHPHQEDHQEQAAPARPTGVHSTNVDSIKPCCPTRKGNAMPRVKRGVTAKARHKKILAKAKGYRGRRSNVYRVANEAVMKAATSTATYARRSASSAPCGSPASTRRCARWA